MSGAEMVMVSIGVVTGIVAATVALGGFCCYIVLASLGQFKKKELNGTNKDKEWY